MKASISNGLLAFDYQSSKAFLRDRIDDLNVCTSYKCGMKYTAEMQTYLRVPFI